MHSYKLSPFLVIHLVLILGFFTLTKVQCRSLKDVNVSVEAMYVFGDSTVDSGNNNYILTETRSNFPPYGTNFADHTPTGRFSDGLLVPDFIALFLGLKRLPCPYLDPAFSIDEPAVNFASAGSGFELLTQKLLRAMPPSKQLELFQEYKVRLELAIGSKRAEDRIKGAPFVVSVGSPDYISDILTRDKSLITDQSRVQTSVQLLRQFVQGLWELGARKIGVAGLPPLGCIPVVITLEVNKTLSPRNCIDIYNNIAKDYNKMLDKELTDMHTSLVHSGARIGYIDIYNPLIDIILFPYKYGFEDVNRGCCGTGLIEISFLCNPKLICPDASKHVFWDSVHPTQATYQLIFTSILPKYEFFLGD